MTQELLPNFLWKVSEVSRNSGEICPPNVLFLSPPPPNNSLEFQKCKEFLCQIPNGKFLEIYRRRQIHCNSPEFLRFTEQKLSFFFLFLESWPRGSVLTWSNIQYYATGRVLLEDVYEQRQAAKTRKKKKEAQKSKKEFND